MADCCKDKNCALEQLRERQSGTLKIVLAINAVMFLVVLAAGLYAACLGLLWKHRHEDVNMASVWECSRNDIAANLAVLFAGGAVWFTGSGWPDLLIGALLAALFCGPRFACFARPAARFESLRRIRSQAEGDPHA